MLTCIDKTHDIQYNEKLLYDGFCICLPRLKQHFRLVITLYINDILLLYSDYTFICTCAWELFFFQKTNLENDPDGNDFLPRVLKNINKTISHV